MCSCLWSFLISQGALTIVLQDFTLESLKNLNICPDWYKTIFYKSRQTFVLWEVCCKLTNWDSALSTSTLYRAYYSSSVHFFLRWTSNATYWIKVILRCLALNVILYKFIFFNANFKWITTTIHTAGNSYYLFRKVISRSSSGSKVTRLIHLEWEGR